MKTLLQKTVKLLNESDLTPKAIAEATGLKPRFMYNLKNNYYPDPSVNKVEVVYNYLFSQLQTETFLAYLDWLNIDEIVEASLREEL